MIRRLLPRLDLPKLHGCVRRRVMQHGAEQLVRHEM